MPTASEHFAKFLAGAVQYFDDREHGRPARFPKREPMPLQQAKAYTPPFFKAFTRPVRTWDSEDAFNRRESTPERGANADGLVHSDDAAHPISSLADPPITAPPSAPTRERLAATVEAENGNSASNTRDGDHESHGRNEEASPSASSPAGSPVATDSAAPTHEKDHSNLEAETANRLLDDAQGDDGTPTRENDSQSTTGGGAAAPDGAGRWKERTAAVTPELARDALEDRFRAIAIEDEPAMNSAEAATEPSADGSDARGSKRRRISAEPTTTGQVTSAAEADRIAPDAVHSPKSVGSDSSSSRTPEYKDTPAMTDFYSLFNDGRRLEAAQAQILVVAAELEAIERSDLQRATALRQRLCAATGKTEAEFEAGVKMLKKKKQEKDRRRDEQKGNTSSGARKRARSESPPPQKSKRVARAPATNDSPTTPAASSGKLDPTSRKRRNEDRSDEDGAAQSDASASKLTARGKRHKGVAQVGWREFDGSGSDAPGEDADDDLDDDADDSDDDFYDGSGGNDDYEYGGGGGGGDDDGYGGGSEHEGSDAQTQADGAERLRARRRNQPRRSRAQRRGNGPSDSSEPESDASSQSKDSNEPEENESSESEALKFAGRATAPRTRSRVIESEEPDDEPVDLTDARNWPPYEIDADDTEACIEKTGYSITLLLSEDETTLGDASKEEQLHELSTTLKENLEHGNFQYLLPPSEDADELLPLTSCIPAEVVKPPDAGPYAIQPLPSALNRQIGLGLIDNLTYYSYPIEAFASSREQGDAFVVFMKSPAIRAHAKDRGQLSTLNIWYKGLDEFIKLGGWAGEFLRLFSYVGESDGWDRLDKRGNAPIRPLQHLVGLTRKKLSFHQCMLQSYLRYSLTNPDAEIKLYLTFISTAEHLPDDMPLCQVKLIEALLCQARLSSVTLGGANIAACGRTSGSADIQNALAPLPPLVPIRTLWTDNLVPRSIACMLTRKFEDNGTTCAQILARLNVEAEQKKRKRSKHRRKRGPRKPKFQNGFYGPANFDTPSGKTLKELRRRYKLRLSGVSITPRIEGIVAPFVGASYFRALVEITKNTHKDADTIMTPDNAGQGIVVNLTGGGKSGKSRERHLRFTIAAGKKAERVAYRVMSDHHRGPVVVTIRDQRMRVWRFGRVLRLRVTPGPAADRADTEPWSWNEADADGKWRGRAKQKEHWDTKRQRDVEAILHELFKTP